MSALRNLSHHTPQVEKEAFGRAPQGPSWSNSHEIYCSQLLVVARSTQGLVTASEIVSVMPSCERITPSYIVTCLDLAFQAMAESLLRLCGSIPLRSYVLCLC